MTSAFDPWAVLREAREKGAGQGASSVSSPISSPISRAQSEAANRETLMDQRLNPQISGLAGLAGSDERSTAVSRGSPKKERKEIPLSFHIDRANPGGPKSPDFEPPRGVEITPANPANLLTGKLSRCDSSLIAKNEPANRDRGCQLIGEGGDWEERAAILEHDGGHSREAAEALAQPAPAAAPWPAPIGATPAGPLLREWVAGLSRLAPSVIPCRDYRPEEWAAVLSNAWHFIEIFGEQAEALGWRTHELFGVHPTHGTIRVDHCGALVLVIGGPVRALTADAIRFERVTARRRPHAPVGIPIWEAAR
ncbi:hypothetical protein [Methylobacterium ajmalii]|jgi:hypothetical protein|uniref:hypothetical protein n=1 Tax=Methylobacterium ajmalii TaxID=2738439 RepID=UPI00190BE74A|nr:hypothetical protein [Methylobacterium ajmalii]MBK3400827.1 hypothetical protein [Methylobacterium ajmalii]MBK3412269.1 hypothetical protein [Methylobacterium ajmalii]MBK3426890.1 hypothetical protein [Methylobacterium ajmalii]MBZ6416925.1 hypothetical protein [Methylobacterium sp.]